MEKNRLSQQNSQAVSHKGQLGKQSKRKDKSKGVKRGDAQGEHLRGGMGNDKLGTQTKGVEATATTNSRKVDAETKESSGCGSTPVDSSHVEEAPADVWQSSLIKPGDSGVVPLPGTRNKRSAVKHLLLD